MPKNFWIYGANGYTGNLIAREAKRRGLSPVLAGRNASALAKLGEELGLPIEVFDCISADEIAVKIENAGLILHCAGPFSATSQPMLEACIRTRTHYLDITGEISVFEKVRSLEDRVREAGIVAIPGVGFDVVPSDCLAALLQERMPSATHLALGFRSSPNARLSPGTAKTMVEGISSGGAIRKDGVIISVPPAYKVRKIQFGQQAMTAQLAMTIPWGDVSTAFYSTQIPNIEVYIPTTMQVVRLMKVLHLFRKPLSSKIIQKLLKAVAGKLNRGPDFQQRETITCTVWGEVSNASGEVKTLKLKIPEGYGLTVLTALASVERLLSGPITAGVFTPSQVFGSRFILEFPGVSLIESEG